MIHSQVAPNEEVLVIHKRGFRIATHGNGDSAIGPILEPYEYALSTEFRSDHRHRIEHFQTATPEDLEKMKGLGVVGAIFLSCVLLGRQTRTFF